jgi:hypothetical protein
MRPLGSYLWSMRMTIFTKILRYPLVLIVHKRSGYRWMIWGLIPARASKLRVLYTHHQITSWFGTVLKKISVAKHLPCWTLWVKRSPDPSSTIQIWKYPVMPCRPQLEWLAVAYTIMPPHSQLLPAQDIIIGTMEGQSHTRQRSYLSTHNAPKPLPGIPKSASSSNHPILILTQNLIARGAICHSLRQHCRRHYHELP